LQKIKAAKKDPIPTPPPTRQIVYCPEQINLAYCKIIIKKTCDKKQRRHQGCISFFIPS
jgi:hypothetical protein